MMSPLTKKVIQIFTLLNAIIFLFSLPVLAQTGTTNDDDETCKLIRPEPVYVWVTVESATSQLSEKEFYLTENGQKQTLVFWLQLPQNKKNITRYKIGYYSTDERLDGKIRNIQVTVKTKEGKPYDIQYWPQKYRAKTTY